MCWSSLLLVAIITVTSVCTEDSSNSIGVVKRISKRETDKEACYIPTPPEHLVLSTHRRRLCPSGEDSPACRLVPGTPVADQWVIYLGCQPGFNLSREVRATVCRDGQWRPPLPTCVLFNASSGNEDSLESGGPVNQTVLHEAHKGPCYIPTPPEHGVLRTHHGFCPRRVDSPACRLVPGTPVTDLWVMHFRCHSGFNMSREVRTTMCQNGRWRPSLPACMSYTEYNSKKQYVLGKQSGKIILFDFEDNTPKVRPLRQQNLTQFISDFTIDCTNRQLYWVEYPNSVIKRSALYGAGLTDIVNNLELSISAPLTLDWVNRKLYVSTGISNPEIKSVDLESGKIKTVGSTSYPLPLWIVVHPSLRKIYWCSSNFRVTKIHYFSLNDSSSGTLVSDVGSEPWTAAIDWATQELCWINRILHIIECHHLESGNRRIVVSEVYSPTSSLAITTEKYFWIEENSLKWVDKFLPTAKTTIPTPGRLVDNDSRIEIVTDQTCPF